MRVSCLSLVVLYSVVCEIVLGMVYGSIVTFFRVDEVVENCDDDSSEC